MAYNSETDKIDKLATDGLVGVVNSLAYRAEEIEKHLHNREKWFGVAGTPSGETHVADRMVGDTAPLQLTAGNNDFGSWVQIIGSADTPVSSGMVKFDGHRVLVTNTDSVNPYIIQVAQGESADLAAKIAAEEFTEFPYVASTNNIDTGISDIMTIRVDSTTKIWARCACVGSSGSILDLYYGIHEYTG